MKRAVTITDLTQMRSQRVCIAGYFDDFKCVRPVDANQRIDKNWIVDSHEAVVHPFAIVEFNFEDKMIIVHTLQFEDRKIITFTKNVVNVQD